MATAYASIRNRINGDRTTMEIRGDVLLITADVQRELPKLLYRPDDWVIESVLFPGTAEVSK